MAIVRYTLIARADGGLSDPRWLADHPDPHQLWHDPDDGSSVGVTPANVELDAAALLARAESIHARHPLKNTDGSIMTAGELAAAVTAWISAAGA